jgi:CTP:molybdopterin cytidylyltransferase MocA
VKPALVVLAAGESRRLGTCKALVDLGGRTPLARLLAAGAGVDGAPPLVVAGAHAERIEAALPRGVELVRNEAWARGRTGGIELARERRRGLDLVLAPVDVPLVPRAVFDALLAAWEAAGAPAAGWLAPAAGGHPVLLGRELVAGLGRFDPDEPLRRLRSRARPLWVVPVASSAVLDDLDTPEDLERLQRLAEREP